MKKAMNSTRDAFGRLTESSKNLFHHKDTVEAHPDIHQFALDENLLVPAIPSKSLEEIQDMVTQEVRRLSKIKNLRVSTVRQGEVIKVVMPLNQLFLPNDTTLWGRADLSLRPFMRYVRIPDYFHIMLVVHSDNTGSPLYTMNLSKSRSIAVRDWFVSQGGSPEYIVTYAKGSTEPIYTNNSEIDRDRNRRIEIYLIPAEGVIKDARKKRINFSE